MIQSPTEDEDEMEDEILLFQEPTLMISCGRRSPSQTQRRSTTIPSSRIDTGITGIQDYLDSEPQPWPYKHGHTLELDSYRDKRSYY